MFVRRGEWQKRGNKREHGDRVERDKREHSHAIAT
jgi:hypothetical protein